MRDLCLDRSKIEIFLFEIARIEKSNARNARDQCFGLNSIQILIIDLIGWPKFVQDREHLSRKCQQQKNLQ